MKYRVICLSIFILVFSVISQEMFCQESSDDSSSTVAESRIPGRRSYYSYSLNGIGPIVAIGASRYIGKINYEELNGQGTVDTQHDDNIRHRFTYGLGMRYIYVQTSFLGYIGFAVDILYQRYGLEIDNSNGMLSGVPYSGGQHMLSLDYVYINPTLRFSTFSFGVYLGFLSKAYLSGNDVTDQFKKVDFGFTVAMDFTLPFKKSGYLFSIIFEGVFGAVNMLKNSSRSLRNIGFNFKFAYMFTYEKSSR